MSAADLTLGALGGPTPPRAAAPGSRLGRPKCAAEPAGAVPLGVLRPFGAGRLSPPVDRCVPYSRGGAGARGGVSLTRCRAEMNPRIRL